MDNYDCFAQEYKEGSERFDGETRRYFYSFLPDLKEKDFLMSAAGLVGMLLSMLVQGRRYAE